MSHPVGDQQDGRRLFAVVRAAVAPSGRAFQKRGTPTNSTASDGGEMTRAITLFKLGRHGLTVSGEAARRLNRHGLVEDSKTAAPDSPVEQGAGLGDMPTTPRLSWPSKGDSSVTQANGTGIFGDHRRQLLGLRTGSEPRVFGGWRITVLRSDSAEQTSLKRVMTTDSPTTAGATHVDTLMRLGFPRGKGSETTTKNDKMQNPLDIRVFWAGHSRSHLESPACQSAGVRPLARRRRSRKEIRGRSRATALFKICAPKDLPSSARPCQHCLSVRSERAASGALTAFGSPEEVARGMSLATLLAPCPTNRKLTTPDHDIRRAGGRHGPGFIDDLLDTAVSIEHSHGLVEDSKTVDIYTSPIFDQAASCHLLFRPKRASSSSSPGPSAWETGASWSFRGPERPSVPAKRKHSFNDASVPTVYGHRLSNSQSENRDTSERVPTNSARRRNSKSANAVWEIKGPAFQAFGHVEFGLKPGPKGPGWKNGWPTWAGRRLHPPCVKSSSLEWLDPVKPGVRHRLV